MIDISTLTEADKGREVAYDSIAKTEYGRITSWNKRFIFVRYHTVVPKHPGRAVMARTGETSEATSPEDLEFAS